MPRPPAQRWRTWFLGVPPVVALMPKRLLRPALVSLKAIVKPSGLIAVTHCGNSPKNSPKKVVLTILTLFLLNRPSPAKRRTVSPVSTQVTPPPSFKRPSIPVSMPPRKRFKSKSLFDSKLQQVCDDLKVCLRILEEDLVEAEEKHLLAERGWKRRQVKCSA